MKVIIAFQQSQDSWFDNVLASQDVERTFMHLTAFSNDDILSQRLLCVLQQDLDAGGFVVNTGCVRDEITPMIVFIVQIPLLLPKQSWIFGNLVRESLWQKFGKTVEGAPGWTQYVSTEFIVAFP